METETDKLGDRAKRAAQIQRSVTIVPRNENTHTNKLYL
jgi:hypothetical protein